MADDTVQAGPSSQQELPTDKSTEGLIFVPDRPGARVSRRRRRRPAPVLAHRKPGKPEQSSQTPETPSAPKRPSPPDAEETFNWRVKEARDGSNFYIQDLISVARGAALILESMWESMKNRQEQAVISGLASALFDAIEPADAYYFESLGEVNKRRIPLRHYVHLLEKELEKARQKLVAKQSDEKAPNAG